ncbi:hypothetical protein [Bradyrhizobium sp. AUGA SZCCT0182]|uniref:hypothetical protein n=1 Tax=Bradyrhizobium sp. AUGA SZCCT0182 TaxID=2807667 RepID=UPI001BAA0DC7|nr:hypothetical protein [Bradyrhizobium sp. AUGA SZCCT0182]MBR1233666.1 hypothetical protein [Bradyrhizobium sp. AUGA SZCCT0182]
MPALVKSKHEIVAQALAAGKSQADAYRAGGYIYKAANAHRLCRSVTIEARVQEIIDERAKSDVKAREIGVQRAGLTEEWVIVRLKHVIDLSIRGLPIYDRGGNPTGLFKSNLEAAINGLRTAAQILGLLVQKREVGNPGSFARMTDAELTDALLVQCKAIGLSDGTLEEIRASVIAC